MVIFICPTELLYLQKSKNKLYGMSMMITITRKIEMRKISISEKSMKMHLFGRPNTGLFIVLN